MKCIACNKGKMRLVSGRHNGVAYSAYKCDRCGEEIMNLAQTKRFMQATQKARTVTFSKWGQALAVRIPVEAVKRLHLNPGEKAKLSYDDKELTITPC